MLQDKKGSGKWLSLLMTVLVVSALIAIGPAQAFVLSMYVHDGGLSAVKGQKIPITMKLDFESDDHALPIKDFRFIFMHEPDGKEWVCTFNMAGEPIKKCQGVKVVEARVPEPLLANGAKTATYNNQIFNFGYGYGLADSVEYTIEIDSNYFETGPYKAKFIAFMGEDTPNPMRFPSDIVRFEIMDA